VGRDRLLTDCWPGCVLCVPPRLRYCRSAKQLRHREEEKMAVAEEEAAIAVALREPGRAEGHRLCREAVSELHSTFRTEVVAAAAAATARRRHGRPHTRTRRRKPS
jgi:hypothetical protein